MAICKRKGCGRPTNRPTTKYCSRTCYYYAKTLNPGWKRCKHCGKSFTRRKNERLREFRVRKGCSVKCAAWVRRGAPSLLNPRRRQHIEPLTPREEALMFADAFYARMRNKYGVPPYQLCSRQK